MELNDFIKELNRQIRQNNQKNQEKQIKNTEKRMVYLITSILIFLGFIGLLFAIISKNQTVNEHKVLVTLSVSVLIVLAVHFFSEYQRLRNDEKVELRMTFDELCQKKVNFPDGYLEKIYDEFKGGVITLRKLKNILVRLRSKDNAIKKLSAP